MLTAASCVNTIVNGDTVDVQAAQIYVYVGQNGPNSGKLHNVKEVTRHENYVIGKLEFNIALLSLKTPIIYDKTVQAACLPLKRLASYKDASLIMSGWRMNNHGKSTNNPQIFSTEQTVKECPE